MRSIVVVGTSSGGLEALREAVAAVPPDFQAAIAVVMHTSPQSPGILAEILDRTARVPVTLARDGERLAAGRVYIAPPDRHLLVEPGVLRVTKGPRENRFRPAIDPLFRSAAQVYGPRAIGVILTGNLDDGTSGLTVIKRLGGIAIVQDPKDALFPSMPRSAIAHVAVDYVVPLAQIVPLLVDIVAGVPDAHRAGAVPPDVEIEVKIAKEQNAVDAGIETLGDPSPFACPECHGVLRQVKDASQVRFRCHTGHAYSVDSLVAAAREGVEESLWNSVRALEEAGLLLNFIAERLSAAPEHRRQAEAIAADAAKARRDSNAIRSVVNDQDPGVRSSELPPAEAADRLG